MISTQSGAGDADRIPDPTRFRPPQGAIATQSALATRQALIDMALGLVTPTASRSSAGCVGQHDSDGDCRGVRQRPLRRARR
ncbi:MAG: hypothetical protein U0521_19730 [Anaerolineae bacterium]